MQDSLGFWIPYFMYWIQDFLSVELGIPDSNKLVEFWIPEPRIPDSTRKISLLLDSTSKNFLHSGFLYMGRNIMKECTRSLLLLVHVDQKPTPINKESLFSQILHQTHLDIN